MHVLLIHQAFVSAQEAGGTDHYELAGHLAQQGHRVTIIASTVNYLTGTQPPSLDGRGRWVEHEGMVEVRRTWTYGAIHHSYFTRLLSFLSFMATSFVGA